MNANLGESRLLPPGSSPSAGQPTKATPSPVNADGLTENQDTDETATIYKVRRELTQAAGGALIPLYGGVFEPVESGPGELHPAITGREGPLTASGTIDGADFDAGPVTVVASTPDPDLGGFDVEFAPVDPTGWTDEGLEAGDRR